MIQAGLMPTEVLIRENKVSETRIIASPFMGILSPFSRPPSPASGRREGRYQVGVIGGENHLSPMVNLP